MKSTSDLFNEMILLGRLIQMVNQKKIACSMTTSHLWILPRPSFACSAPFVAKYVLPR